MSSINTNMSALNAQFNLSKQTKEMEQAMARLSSGLRINSAADDAAGSAIASKMDTQVKSLGVAIRNANDAISLTQTAEGALGEIENILQRMRELSVQASNSTLNQSDRNQIQLEINQLASEVDAISTKTHFNNVNLLNGSTDKVTMQIGSASDDTLDIALDHTSVAALGIGSSDTVTKSTFITDRMIALGTATIAATDIKLNGEDIFASNFDPASTTVRGVTGDDQSGALSGTAASTGQFGAIAVAEAINGNTGKHGVKAEAFNVVTAKSNVYTAGAITINNIVVQSQATLDEFIAAVNSQVIEVEASINNEGFLQFTNDGAAITFAAAFMGIAADTYAGFVKMENTDGTAVQIEAGSKDNGFQADTGNLSDLLKLGMVEVRPTATGSVVYSSNAVVDGTVLQASDGLKINDVLIEKLESQTTSNVSAADKANAINAKSALTGVTARGVNSVDITIDLDTPTMSHHSDATVQGVTIDFSGDNTLADVVSAINTGLAGKSDVIATATSTGDLRLSSASGVTITFDDTAGTTGQGKLFTGSSYTNDGTSITSTNGTATARGFLELTSLNGNAIKIEDGQQDTTVDSGTDRIGFSSSNEEGTESKGVSVSTVSSATSSLSSLDAALEKVSKFRASFGAYENRLDATINNLTTLKVNTEAAKSRIADADFAAETSNMTKSQILSQAATSMLAQANASKQNLLALLQG